MRPTLEILGDLMWRPPATEAEHWFGVALVKHLHEGLPLAQALGIPRTANRLRIEMRNFHLIRAAQALPDMRPRTLIAAVAAFRDYRWPKWGIRRQAHRFAIRIFGMRHRRGLFQMPMD